MGNGSYVLMATKRYFNMLVLAHRYRDRINPPSAMFLHLPLYRCGKA